MCGRYTLRTPLSKLVEVFRVETVQLTFPEFTPRYNIAPTQEIPVVAADDAGKRELVAMRWGMAFEGKGASNPLINARAETVAKLPAFRDAFRSRRCLVVADGFYEWRKEGAAKQPFYFHLPDDAPFAFAGIWSHRSDTRACAIITTTAVEPVASVHTRMPVILSPDDYALWLDDAIGEPERLEPLLNKPQPLVAHPVSTAVNSPKNNSEACIAPVTPMKNLSLFDE